jgi:hypothetical protein
VDLLDGTSEQALPGWSVRQLQVLGWLALVSVLANTLLVGLLFAGSLLEAHEAELLFTFTDWLGLMLVLLGCYLLLRLKAFAEARFAARNLSLPVWAVLTGSLLLELADLLFGEQLFTAPGWQTLSYMALLCLTGISTAWLGIRLLSLQYPYPALKVMAWLDIVGGLMLASVLLTLLALLPLLGAGVTLMLVFFRGAAEMRAKAS